MSWMTCSAYIAPTIIAISLCLAPTPATPVAGQPKPAAKAKPVVFRNFTLHTGTGDKPIPDAVLIVKDGKIAAAGTKADVGPAPDDAEVIDLAGAVVIPGLVDTHSHIGVWSRPGVAGQPGRQRGKRPGATRHPRPRRDQPGRSRHPHGHRRRRHHREHHARLRQRHRRADALREAPRPHRRGDAHHRPAADGVDDRRRPQDGQRREPQGLRQEQAAGPVHADEGRRPPARDVSEGQGIQGEEGRRARKSNATSPSNRSSRCWSGSARSTSTATGPTT